MNTQYKSDLSNQNTCPDVTPPEICMETSKKENSFSLKKQVAAVAMGICVVGATPNISEAKTHNSQPITQNYKNTNSTCLNKMAASRNHVGGNEIAFFAHFFQVKETQQKRFIDKVQALQAINGINPDGVIGPQTLKMLYTKYYSKHSGNLPPDIQARWDFYKIWQSPRYKQFSKPNVFSKSGFYGTMGTKNVPNTLKDESLEMLAQQGKLAINFQGKTINITEHGKANRIYIGKSVGKIKLPGHKYGQNYIFGALYDDNGDLKVLAYISPGSRSHKSRENTIYNSQGVIKNYISKKYKATMANATGVDRRHGIYLHHSRSVTGKPASHGCHRTTAIGSQAFAKYTSQDTYKIIIGKLY